MSGVRLTKAIVLMLAGLLAAWSWLFIVSKWGPATRLDILTFKSGLTSKVMRTLLQPAYGGRHLGHDTPSVSGIYATPEYYAMTEQTREAAEYLPERFAVFYLFEDIHVGELPPSPPSLKLRRTDGAEFESMDTEIIRDSPHHRVTVARFHKADANGSAVIGDDAPFFELVARPPSSAHGDHGETLRAGYGGMMSATAMAAGQPNELVMRWDLPIVYPTDLNETSPLSLPTLVALLAGLLAVLSPCLLQLTIYYTFALAGISVRQDPMGIREARGQVIRTALYFMAGFTIVFTAAGALAGFAGERIQSSGILEDWNRPLAIAAGAGILLLGVWMGATSGAPGLCRLPLPAALRSERGWWDRAKMMFMGSAFAIGCSTCFGGALFISLMIYVGTVGSTSVGALALFLFSLGIGIPYLLSAVFISRALPLLSSFQRAASGVALVCSVVLIFFGVILITDTFHIPSNLLYRVYLGL